VGATITAGVSERLIRRRRRALLSLLSSPLLPSGDHATTTKAHLDLVHNHGLGLAEGFMVFKGGLAVAAARVSWWWSRRGSLPPNYLLSPPFPLCGCARPALPPLDLTLFTNGTSGFGQVSVSGRRRVPYPPTRMSALRPIVGVLGRSVSVLFLWGGRRRGSLFVVCVRLLRGSSTDAAAACLVLWVIVSVREKRRARSGCSASGVAGGGGGGGASRPDEPPPARVERMTPSMLPNAGAVSILHDQVGGGVTGCRCLLKKVG
jgi:hypothetical protein